ncbi:MAG: M20/M25/M40 family metallo-hydrolase [Alphaproteobacteria bacterium]|nr:M20/M25/M40 family metallo-hydrolase [Alphaproteobacteria bacterium]
MSAPNPAALSDAIERRLAFADGLFQAIRERTKDSVGVTRPAWSQQDQVAGEVLIEAANGLGIEASWDAAGNLLLTLAGRDRTAPGILTGSHLDSVPTGGHYDGLAGAIAGLTVQAAFRDLGHVPTPDLTTIGIRGEESVWYGIAYVGSRLAVGSLPHAQLSTLKRGDSGLTLAQHMQAVGVDVDALGKTAPWITARNTKAFLELHIEQAPILVNEGLPVAIPTVIRGNVRFPYARCTGRYDHSGATPRIHRSDALLAVVELLRELDEFWIASEAAGAPDTVFTVGKLFTDAAHHAMTKVPGRVDFTLNFGGTTQDFLDACRERTHAGARRLAALRHVDFDLGECVGSDPTPLDPGLRRALLAAGRQLGLAEREFATVGHDASIFARAGIPSAMILVRNDHGSHNPDEAMDMADFGAGAKLLALAIAKLAD